MEAQVPAGGVASAGPAVGQLSCSMASTLLRYVRAKLGEPAVQALLQRADVQYTPAFLDDVSNWIWYDEAIALFEAAAALTGDELIGQRVGEATVRQHSGTAVATLLRSLGSPEAIYRQLAVTVTKFSTVTELVPVEVVPGRAVLRARARPGFTRHRHLCAWTQGLLSAPPELFGLPPAKVEESSCEIRGDDHCLYTVVWDADGAASAADPLQLVTALETQLVAMTDRLESMYATARDLIAFDDVEAALARITERAATAVRAPKYLLAVRTGSDGKLQVHHRGFVNDDPHRAARALLEGDGGGQGDVRLVVEVESRTRHYGRLMAASPSGGFLPQERDMFAVYARYAASVLDTATALDDARREQRQSRALLELSQAVARVTTGDEVAARLAAAAPAVLDCDRVTVFLWNEVEHALTCRAVTELTGDAGRLLQELHLRPSDTPILGEMINSAEPRPCFVDAGTADMLLRRLMRQLGSQALTIVPIVTHGRFYGILTASVSSRPERLRPSTGLHDGLAGVVAQAATALDNARLIETMRHQARHDNLTGLLGHRAFHDALEEALDGEHGHAFTLAMMDIDDFKLINDLHGHPMGDEALREVADTLRSCLRDHDKIFRVGGEEFAVLIPGLAAKDALPLAERLRAAVASAAFVLPLRISIGLVSWPQDASDRDELLERADGALYAAKGAGKDRTSLATPDRHDASSNRALPRELIKLLRDKDGETLAHSVEVAALAVDVGAALGLDGERLADLRLGAQLHDIGKIGVPDAILAKPGPLDEDEMTVIRTHPLVGAELARASGLPRAARFILEHHERVDGGGYPAGLSGEQISLEARIIHAVDAFRAMTADRPYRSAMSAEIALTELRSLSGVQFDPDVVKALEAKVTSQSGRAAAKQTLPGGRAHGKAISAKRRRLPGETDVAPGRVRRVPAARAAQTATRATGPAS
jgi:diguanylate cyclase (GGDEF)-like protein/putative nucleotidyltransferase with HDIG domain